MAGGFNKDGAVQDQIDASLADEVNTVRSRLPQGQSLLTSVHCGAAIPEARRKAMAAVRFCLPCQAATDREQSAFAGYNRRGSKDSQLR